MSEADGKHAGTAAGIQQLAGPVETRLLRQDGFELGCIRWTTVPIVGSRAEVDGRVVRHRTSIPASHLHHSCDRPAASRTRTRPRPASKTTRTTPTSARRTRLIQSHSRPRAEEDRGRSSCATMTQHSPRPRYSTAVGQDKDPRPRSGVSKHTSPRAGVHYPNGLHPTILLVGFPRTPLTRISQVGTMRQSGKAAH